MAELDDARDLLKSALRKYSRTQRDCDVELALLAMHTGLEEAFRAYLVSLGVEEAGDRGRVGFPNLVGLIRDRTGLFVGDDSLHDLLIALNTTRNKIAHPRGDKPSPDEIKRDADKLAKLAKRFWPQLFGEIVSNGWLLFVVGVVLPLCACIAVLLLRNRLVY